MIYEPIATSNEHHEIILRRPFFWVDVFMKPVAGLFLIASGGLILHTFLTGGAPHPIGHGIKWAVGAAVTAGGFLLIGVIPTAFGLAVLARSDRVVVDPTTHIVEHQLWFAHLNIWRRRFLFDEFDTLFIDHRRGGFPVSHSTYIIIVKGTIRRLTIGAFQDATSAAKMADRLASLLHLPIRQGT